MKKLIYILFVLIALPMAWSCEKEEEEEEKKEDKYVYVGYENDMLAGIWYHTYEIDSLVLIFEDHTMKEYIYDKKTLKLLERNDCGSYSLYVRVNPEGVVKETYINLPYIDSTSPYYTSYSYYYPRYKSYSISDNILSLSRDGSYIKFTKKE